MRLFKIRMDKKEGEKTLKNKRKFNFNSSTQPYLKYINRV